MGTREKLGVFTPRGTSSGWRKYPDDLSGDYALRGHPVNEGYRFRLRGWSLADSAPTRSMGAREMVGVFPPTCTRFTSYTM
ncbi:hypothetical protein NIES3974_19720 [Calothrix sp. NIES-3974]|nr:hypothetical protein NIES3974_19720 [Calothrix sp. NIES-3974]